MKNPTKEELQSRISGLFALLNRADFDTALIVSRVNQYYFTGTMQDGVLLLKRDGTVAYFVRKSYERAREESPLDCIYPMKTYRDMLRHIPSDLGNTFLETNIMPLGMLERLKKYFAIGQMQEIDSMILRLRAVKSDYELDMIRESGRQHQHLMEQIVPTLLKEGMLETDFLAELYAAMVKLGHHGVSRFSMFEMEMIVGQVGFSDSSVYPTNFDGPGGMRGLCPAVPIIGSRERRLSRGDLVFVDVGYGVLGYHSDKTQVYSFGRTPSAEAVSIHHACMDVQKKAAGLLTVGRAASEVYLESMKDLPAVLNENFMGGVRFLGHGVGLHVDEWPVITGGFDMPLEENMVIALEPKCGIKEVGTVGVEETYLVTRDGALCLTGGAREIIEV